jgi:probable rRNA maturation factor
MLDEDSNLDVLIDVDDDRWLEWYTPDQWHLLLHKIIQQVLNHLGFAAKAEVSILLTTNAEVHKLNKQFRNKDKPTNVLSFPNLTEDELRSIPKNTPYPIMLGDLALAFETLLNESLDEKKTFLDHFNHLVVHGMLHLLGYDHENDEDAEFMQEKEIMILQTLNINNPYQ